MPAGGFVARIRRAPLGVALCLGPYNYAVNEVFTTVIPALVMGNPVVMKTPRYGVLANALLVPALQESFPKGVINMVTGQGPTVVGPMMESGLVDVLALIGSARTASVLLKQHPHPYRLRTLLGMGAKNPAIVLQDADLDAAAAEIVSGALNFNGQRCTALKHVLVERKVADALVERLADHVARLKVGMPWEEKVTITPLPDPQKPAHLAGLVEDALAKGARVVNPGGGAWAGTLFRPALVYPVPEAAELYRAEQFGPILPVSVVDSPEQALDAIERSDVGQQASVFGRDAATIGRLRRPPREPRLPREPQHAVPPRPRRVPVRRAQGLGSGHALGHRCAARLLDPQHGGGDRRRSARSSRRSGHTPCSSARRPTEGRQLKPHRAVTSAPRRRPSARRYCSSVAVVGEDVASERARCHVLHEAAGAVRRDECAGAAVAARGPGSTRQGGSAAATRVLPDGATSSTPRASSLAATLDRP